MSALVPPLASLMRISTPVRVLAALGTLSAGVWAGTLAAFSDTGDATSTFSTGSVVLELNDSGTSPYAFTSLGMTNAAPGAVTYATLKVENAGTIASTYSMTSTETDAALSGELQLGAVVNAATCDAGGYGDAVGTPANVVIANGDLADAAIGSRALAGAASETLCVRVELPSGTGNGFQGDTTTSTFAFTLTQA